MSSPEETRPSLPPQRVNKDLEMLREAGRHLDKFLCQGDQRTDLFNSEVPLISILDKWAECPYPNSMAIAKRRKMNIQEHKLDFLSGYLVNFKKFRLSRERKGRKEDENVMMGYMNMLADALRNHEKMPGYLK